MSAFSVPQKRRASRAPSSQSSSSNTLIEISDDDEQPRPQKRKKSAAPLHSTNSSTNGFVQRNAQPAKAGASVAQLFSSPPHAKQFPSRDIKPVSWQPDPQGKVISEDEKERERLRQLRKFIPSINKTLSSQPTIRKTTPAHIYRPKTMIDEKRQESIEIPSDSDEEGHDSSNIQHAGPPTIKPQPSRTQAYWNRSRMEQSQQATPPASFPNGASKKSLDNAIDVRPTPQATPVSTPRPSQNFQLSVPIRPSPSPVKAPYPVPGEAQHHGPTKSQHQASAKARRPTTPLLQSNLQLVVPRSQTKEDYEAKRIEVFEKLKADSSFAVNNQDVVKKYFGSNGFSEAFAVEDLSRKFEATNIYQRPMPDPIPLPFPEYKPPKPRYDKRGKLKRVPSLTSEEMIKVLDAERFEEFSAHPALTFKNDINDRYINGRFQFTDRYIIRPGVKQSRLNNTGCGCVDECRPSTCDCLVKSFEGESHRVNTYIVHPEDPDLIVLDPDYMANELNAEAQHHEIIECNEFCGCGPSCWNRTVSRGRTVPLEIFMTEKCGFGVRSSEDIRKGQFIDLYLGELITQRELELRESIKQPGQPSYIYSLDWFSSTNCYHVDGEEFGSAMRFVNHSCNPNARNFTVQTHRAEKPKVYSLAFFAICDIPAGEQITIDYSPQEALAMPPVVAEQIKRSSSDVGHDKDMYGAPGSESGKENVKEEPVVPESPPDGNVNAITADDWSDSDEGDEPVLPKQEEAADGRSRCYCGAPNCRGYLWPEAAGRRRKKKSTRGDYY
ncbi:Histone-lysine N-methyltransferase, H3 lysine-9 specific [Cyphellophora attinorum]|uniref:Histone-lysine N-methyltransferase, H3 lysine-9 specific n=1 Tax=Cyphellophora attinorum TaxID=1664694 RepID=A0A0N1HTP1_9EURO|nr:Histone-lysine N-methyltransferase, H3 lysine-9 specific [Phialophora attinorum]KPI42472.1 Histone-lysine N-methyltransferase, H3 lysine-9 specific [Phialophora attinorum]